MKTTKKHYEYFKDRCRYYQKELGLMDWDLAVIHKNIESMARCYTKSTARVCTITLTTKNWDDLSYDPLNETELDMLAWHEVCHLRLADLVALGESRYVQESEIDVELERAVTALENFFRAHIL